MNRRSVLGFLGMTPAAIAASAGSAVGGPVARFASGGVVGSLAAEPLRPMQVGEVMTLRVDAGHVQGLIRAEFMRHGISMAEDHAGFVNGDGI